MKPEDISKMHKDSFDFAMSTGLANLCEKLQPCEMEFPETVNIKLYKF
jgi:hypothetical protein